MKVAMNSKAGMTRAAIWFVASVLFLDVALGKVRELHAAGLVVSRWRYAQVGFWVVMLVFWLWQGWQAYQARRKVS